MTQHSITVGVDHQQFYVWDPSVTNQAPEAYTEEDIRCRVKLAPSVLVIQPVRDGEVPFTLDLRDEDPGFDALEWDQVVECSIDLPGGKLQVHECLGGSVLDLDMERGCYVVRVLFGALARTSSDGLDGEDRYSAQIWPGSLRELRVVKEWS